MFGYVRARVPELRVREYDYYRASYCGLCRAMGRCTGACSRLTLSYDFVFLAQVRMALRGAVPTFRRRRCAAHPLRRRRMMERNAELDFTAAASAILSYEKCRDDRTDERGLRRLRARFQSLFLLSAYRRAKRRLPGLGEAVREKLRALAALEAERRASVDEPAALFGELLAELAAWGLAGNEAKLARRIGMETGRFIYLIDAFDDMADDRRRGSYNPFLLLFEGEPGGAERAGVRDAIFACLSDLAAAMDLLEEGDGPPERRAVLENILYLGMPGVVRQVLDGAADPRKEETGEEQSL